MRTRAYRPEMPGHLEDRSLLSGVAGTPGDPIVLPHRRLNTVALQERLAFYSFGRDRDVDTLRNDIYDVAVIVPYGRSDGLGASINRIVDRMQDDLADGVPHAIRSAQKQVLAATLADVNARVQAGDVVVR